MTGNGIKRKPITQLQKNETGVILALIGGCGFERRLRSVGIREGKLLRVVASHPLSGPLVVEVDRRQVTLGRGMAQRIEVSCKP